MSQVSSACRRRTCSEAKTAEEMAVRLGARSMPVEGKRKVAAAGNAMDAELIALTEYMTAMDRQDLGRAASRFVRARCGIR